MNKDQKKFLYQEVQRAISKKKQDFVKANPIQWTAEEKTAKLKAAGFVCKDSLNYVLGYLHLPLTKVHNKNLVAYDKLCEKLDKAMYDLKVQVELGDADAVAVLKDFLALVEKA